MSARRENEHKQFVEVRAEHQLDGTIRPMMFREEDDLYTHIDEIIDVREAPALRAGGQGVRYTCRVQDQAFYLFHDDIYWFIEDSPTTVGGGTTKARRRQPAMCGRYFIEADQDNQEMRQIIEQLNRRYQDTPEREQMSTGEVFPTAIVPVLSNSRALKPSAFLMRWGFSHFDGGGVIINARSETAMEKPLFQKSMRERRCVIPCGGYYEWRRMDKAKQKYAIRAEGEGLTYMAGIYRMEEGEKLPTFAILTRDAAPSIAFIHHRMPVLLSKEDQQKWLDPNANVTELLSQSPLPLRFDAAKA